MTRRRLAGQDGDRPRAGTTPPAQTRCHRRGRALSSHPRSAGAVRNRASGSPEPCHDSRLGPFARARHVHGFRRRQARPAPRPAGRSEPAPPRGPGRSPGALVKQRSAGAPGMGRTRGRRTSREPAPHCRRTGSGPGPDNAWPGPPDARAMPRPRPGGTRRPNPGPRRHQGRRRFSGRPARTGRSGGSPRRTSRWRGACSGSGRGRRSGTSRVRRTSRTLR